MFAGSKLLHSFELRPGRVSLDDLLSSCQSAGLTGFAEVKLPAGAGMILYYFGNEVNVMYREGSLAYHGSQALEKLRAQIANVDGAVSVYELPMDVAHLLRGISNRKKLPDLVATSVELTELLARLESDQHTGTLELQSEAGMGLILLVAGRVSNVYWETLGGVTYEKGEARERLDATLSRAPAQVFLSEFSREAWRNRSEMPSPSVVRGERWDQLAVEQLAKEENALRARTLEQLNLEVPSLVKGMFIDLYTGAVLARRSRGSEAIQVALLAQKLPSFIGYIRDVVEAGSDQLDSFEIASRDATTIVALVPEAREALVVIADKSQPTTQLLGAIQRAAHRYTLSLAAGKTVVVAQAT